MLCYENMYPLSSEFEFVMRIAYALHHVTWATDGELQHLVLSQHI